MPHVIWVLVRICPIPRQTRLRALQRLALGFLVAAQHQRLVRRVEVEPDDVPELLFKALVVGQFEGARQMRLDVTGRPQALHAGRRNPGGARHRAATPPPQMGRRRHRLLQHLLHRGLRQPRLAPAPGTIAQPLQPAQPKRPTQRFTQSREIPSCSAMRCSARPCALSRMISARCRSRTGTVVARARRSVLQPLPEPTRSVDAP